MSSSEYQPILDFWFSGCELDSPQLDSRMDRWFGADGDFDDRIRREFGDLITLAADGELDHWASEPKGRLALIILLDQFPRNIYRGKAEAFSNDIKALKLTIEGTVNRDHKHLNPVERMFFFMPLQHSESLKIQEKSVSIFRALAAAVPGTLHETFQMTAQFAELHHDIVAEFGRFPHRNAALGRPNSNAESAYLAGESNSFGQ